MKQPGDPDVLETCQELHALRADLKNATAQWNLAETRIEQLEQALRGLLPYVPLLSLPADACANPACAMCQPLHGQRDAVRAARRLLEESP